MLSSCYLHCSTCAADIQSAFYAKNEEYGYQINKGLSGSMHSHVLAFKADLLGPNTTLEMHKVVPREVKYPWSNSTRSTMALERKMVASEDESKLNFNKDTLYLFNTGEKNAYGEKRGWRFMPGRGAGMHLVIQNSENLHKSMAFATHDFYVTKYKDDEEWSAHSSNSYDTRHPILNFAEYFDGESLVEEDLVLWYNLGSKFVGDARRAEKGSSYSLSRSVHHVPHTGDIPVTVQTTAQASMVFSPVCSRVRTGILYPCTHRICPRSTTGWSRIHLVRAARPFVSTTIRPTRILSKMRSLSALLSCRATWTSEPTSLIT